MNERDLTTYLQKRLPRSPRLQTWLDEDCEIIDQGDPNKLLLATVDTSTVRIDFPSNTPAEEIGYFSTALSLSDIAACGGEPLGVLASCSVPPEYSDQITKIYDGINQATRDARTFILGGDTNSAGELSLSIVSLGQVERSKILRRGRARLGDCVGVTDILDRFNYGHYQYHTDPELVDFQRMLRQPAPIRAGRLLARLGCITSCIDLPDGLIKALRDNQPAGLGFIIKDYSIPVDHYRSHVPEAGDKANYELASEPAGDIALLFTTPRESIFDVEDAFQKEGMLVHWIGKVVEEGGIKIKSGDQVFTPTQAGFMHQLEQNRTYFD